MDAPIEEDTTPKSAWLNASSVSLYCLSDRMFNAVLVCGRSQEKCPCLIIVI